MNVINVVHSHLHYILRIIYNGQSITGQLLFKRYTEDEQFGCAAGGTLHVIASILAGAETSADRILAPEFSFQKGIF